MQGGRGNDILWGGDGEGSSNMIGGAGDDVLVGFGGGEFVGEPGADRFVFKGAGKLYVDDFEMGVDNADLRKMDVVSKPSFQYSFGTTVVDFETSDGFAEIWLIDDQATSDDFLF